MATATSKRRSSAKADQDRAQREAKAAEAQPSDAPEASAEELAAQKGRPSNEPVVTEDDLNDEPVDVEGGDLPAIGELTTMSVTRGSAQKSVWTDRLNEAADKLASAGYPEGQGVTLLHCATPKTAANTANGVRRKVKEGTLDGLVEGVTFQIVARGRAILATVTPDAQPEGEDTPEGEQASDEQ